MQYISFAEKANPQMQIRVEYKGELDINLIAGIMYLIMSSGPEIALSLVVDAIEGTLQTDKIMTNFDQKCVVMEDDPHNILNKKHITVADLFS